MKGHPRFIVVTPQLIEAASTRGCGFTDRQIDILDGRGKPERGWRQRAIGKRLSYERAHEFLFAARRPKQRPKPGSAEEARALAVPNACADGGQPRQAALVQSAEIRREPGDTTLIARSMQEPLDDTPPWIDGDDTACPICHGDDLGLLNCQICSAAIRAPSDPWLELERITNDISLNTTTTPRLAITRAAKALHRPGLAVSREIKVVARFVRALGVAFQNQGPSGE